MLVRDKDRRDAAAIGQESARSQPDVVRRQAEAAIGTCSGGEATSIRVRSHVAPIRMAIIAVAVLNVRPQKLAASAAGFVRSDGSSRTQRSRKERNQRMPWTAESQSQGQAPRDRRRRMPKPFNRRLLRPPDDAAQTTCAPRFAAKPQHSS